MRHHVLTEVLFELLNSFAQITDLLDHISGAQQYPVNFNESLVKNRTLSVALFLEIGPTGHR